MSGEPTGLRALSQDFGVHVHMSSDSLSRGKSRHRTAGCPCCSGEASSSLWRRRIAEFEFYSPFSNKNNTPHSKTLGSP